jgi:hypothetical protein
MKHLDSKKGKFVAVVIFFSFVLGLTFYFFSEHKKKFDQRIYLYAWERQEDLSFLENYENVGIAIFALQIDLYNDRIVSHGRTTSVVAPPGKKTVPVIRVDIKEDRPIFSEKALKLISGICNRSLWRECQIDFDFKESQKAFYTAFVGQMATLLDKDVVLTATALPSYCYQGDFFSTIPVAYVVPLLIDVGADSGYLRGKTKSPFKGKKCERAVGVSTYQGVYSSFLFSNKEVYLFSNTAWTKERFEQEVKKYSLH